MSHGLPTVLCTTDPTPNGLAHVFKKCSICRRKVKIAKTTLQSLERNGADDAYYVCLENCAEGYFKSRKGENLEFMPLTEEQMEEISGIKRGHYGYRH